MGIADTEMFLIILKKFLWAMVSCVGLALGAAKSRPKVEILRHSKPNLAAFFARQSRECWRLLFQFRSIEQWELLVHRCNYRRKGFLGNSLLRQAAEGSEKRKLKVKISRYSKPNLTTEVKLL